MKLSKIKWHNVVVATLLSVLLVLIIRDVYILLSTGATFTPLGVLTFFLMVLAASILEQLLD